MSDAAERANLVSLREHLETVMRERERAIEIAAKELARRLDVLNHAHEASITDRTQFVKKETADAERDVMNKRVAALELAAANMAGRLWALGIAAGVVGAGGVIVAQSLFK